MSGAFFIPVCLLIRVGLQFGSGVTFFGLFIGVHIEMDMLLEVGYYRNVIVLLFVTEKNLHHWKSVQLVLCHA